jgi:hypothetical protein
VGAGVAEHHVTEGVGDRLGERLRHPDGERGAERVAHPPGILDSQPALLAADPDPSDDAIRDALAGNLCRCTGYQPIIAAVRRAAAELAGGGLSAPAD